MSEQQQHRELRKPGTLSSILTIAGIIVGFIVILVGLFGIDTNGDVYIFLSEFQGIVGGIVLVLVWAIPGILIGLMVFRGLKKKASSRTVLIVVPAFSGIVGGFVVAGALVFCYTVWIFVTQCC